MPAIPSLSGLLLLAGLLGVRASGAQISSGGLYSEGMTNPDTLGVDWQEHATVGRDHVRDVPPYRGPELAFTRLATTALTPRRWAPSLTIEMAEPLRPSHRYCVAYRATVPDVPRSGNVNSVSRHLLQPHLSRALDQVSNDNWSAEIPLGLMRFYYQSWFLGDPGNATVPPYPRSGNELHVVTGPPERRDEGAYPRSVDLEFWVQPFLDLSYVTFVTNVDTASQQYKYATRNFEAADIVISDIRVRECGTVEDAPAAPPTPTPTPAPALELPVASATKPERDLVASGQTLVLAGAGPARLGLYDHKLIDGDVVTILLNGRVLVDAHTLTAERAWWDLPLSSGENQVVLHAENLGRRPPNTAAIVLEAGGEETVTVLSSDLETSSYFTVVRAE